MDGVVNARNVLIVKEIGGGVPALSWKSVYRAGRVTLASWPTTSVMRRYTAAPL